MKPVDTGAKQHYPKASFPQLYTLQDTRVPAAFAQLAPQSARSRDGGGDARWGHAPSSLGQFAFTLQMRMCHPLYAGLSYVATLVENKTMASSLRGWVSYLLGVGRGLRLVPPSAPGEVRKRLPGEWACLHCRLTRTDFSSRPFSPLLKSVGLPSCLSEAGVTTNNVRPTQASEAVRVP